MAVLTERLKPREAASGKAYSAWRISDLAGANMTLFLFGAAHEQLAKDGSEGSVLALFGAQVCCRSVAQAL